MGTSLVLGRVRLEAHAPIMYQSLIVLLMVAMVAVGTKAQMVPSAPVELPIVEEQEELLPMVPPLLEPYPMMPMVAPTMVETVQMVPTATPMMVETAVPMMQTG